MFRSSVKLLHRTAPSTLFTSRRVTAYRHITQEARSQIQSAIDSHPVVVFMKGTPAVPQCGFSRAVIQVLGIHGVPSGKMGAVDVLADDELRSAIKEFSDWPTVPQIYVNGEFIGGCDIVLGMHQSGELETLLENKGVISKAKEG